MDLFEKTIESKDIYNGKIFKIKQDKKSFLHYTKYDIKNTEKKQEVLRIFMEI